jgi:hypothetical protein
VVYTMQSRLSPRYDINQHLTAARVKAKKNIAHMPMKCCLMVAL